MSNLYLRDTTGLNWVWGEGCWQVIPESATCKLGSVYEQPHHFEQSSRHQKLLLLHRKNLAVSFLLFQSGAKLPFPTREGSHGNIVNSLSGRSRNWHSLTGVTPTSPSKTPPTKAISGFSSCCHLQYLVRQMCRGWRPRSFRVECSYFLTVCVASSSHCLKGRLLGQISIAHRCEHECLLALATCQRLLFVTAGIGPLQPVVKPLDCVVIKKKKLHCWRLRAFKTDYWHFCMNWRQLLIFKSLQW